MALILAATVFWGFTIFNSFFSRPTQLPVGFLFIIAAYLFTERYKAVRSDWRIGALIGAATAFAMLCHGGSIFALLGIGITLLLLRRVPNYRFILAAVGCAAILYFPWMMYQKYYDPPGDRLLKWHLAGEIHLRPDVTFGQLVTANYRKLGLSGIKEYKSTNVRALFDQEQPWHYPAILLKGLVTGNHDQVAAAVAEVRYAGFLHWFWSIDLFSLVPLGILLLLPFVRPKKLEFKQGLYLWFCTVITLIVWCLLMFGPSGTWAFQGCYFTEYAAVLGSILLVWSYSRVVAAVIAVAHMVWSLVIYVWLAPPSPIGAATVAGPKNVPLIFATILIGMALVVALWRASLEPESQPLSDAGADGSAYDRRRTAVASAR
jgi:hypothetical protein